MGEKAIQYESIPMQASLSEGSKKKSKKARQREARKRRSLQGADISGPSVVVTETAQISDGVETPSGVSITESSVQPDLPVAATRANEVKTPSAHEEKAASVGLIKGVESGEHAETGVINENLER